MAWSYIHLSGLERAQIEVHLRLGTCISEIAISLGRARSTIHREIRRNGWRSEAELARRGKTKEAGGYSSVAADRRAQRLAHKARVARKLAPGTALWTLVMDHLHRRLSPVQIARTLRRMPEPVRISYETIYTSLYATPRGPFRKQIKVIE